MTAELTLHLLIAAVIVGIPLYGLIALITDGRR